MSYSNLSKMNFEVSEEQNKFLEQVDAACKSIRDYESDCYLEEKANDRIVPEFGKIGMLGCPISKKYGGQGYDDLNYFLGNERIGIEGKSLPPIFFAHNSPRPTIL